MLYEVITVTFEHTQPLHIMHALESENIESRPLWKPMHLQPLFKDALHVSDGTSEALFAKGLCLPSGTQMERADVERVCHHIKKALCP